MKSPTHFNFKDITGQRFGRLVAKSVDGKSHGVYTWLCDCDCGNKTIVRKNCLSLGTTTSCGCARRDRTVSFNKEKAIHGDAPRGNVTTEFSTWKGIKARCLNPNLPAFKHYGGRGIKLCPRWMDYRNFLKDMGRKPSPELTIHRVDNDGNYEPSNCIWATQDVQNNNKRTTHFIEFEGVVLSLTQWAARIKMHPRTLYGRISDGWDIRKAITTPVCH